MANTRASERAAPDDIFDIASAAFAGVGTESDLLRRVVSDAPVGIALLDADLRWQYVNPEFTRATGLRAADIIGLPVARTTFARHADTLASVLADGLPGATTLGGRTDTPPGIDVRCRRLELRGQAAGIIVVVADGSATPHRQRQELERAHDRLTVLDAAAQRIGTTLDIDTTCAELVAFTAPAMADLAIVELAQPRAAGGTAALPDPACLRRVAVACSPRVRPQLVSLAGPGESVSYGTESPIGRSLRTGTPVVTDLLADTEPGGSDTRCDPTTTACRAAGLGTMLVVPLAAHGRVVGVLILARAAESSLGFPDDDIDLVGEVAARAAVSIDNADRLARAQGTATCLLALADPNRDRWTFSSAGHLPPALIAADRSVELVEVPTGPPLGSGFGGYEQLTRSLRPDETLLLYTDGLVERRDQDIDDSLARLTSLRPPATGALDDLLDVVLGALAPHTPEDDVALLAARVPHR